MSSEHKAPFAAFLVVSIACVVVLANALRSDALGALQLAAPVPVIAGELLLPDAGGERRAAAEDDPADVEHVVPAPPTESPASAPLSHPGARSAEAPTSEEGDSRDRDKDRGRHQAEKPAGAPERPDEDTTGPTTSLTPTGPGDAVPEPGQPLAALGPQGPGAASVHASDHSKARGNSRGKGHGARGHDRRTWGGDPGPAAAVPAWGAHQPKHGQGSAHQESPHGDEPRWDSGTDEHSQPGVGHGRD